MGKDVSSILHTCFFVYESLLGFFCTEAIMRQKKKKWSSSEQGTFLQIQTNIYLYLIGWFSG